MPLEEFRAPNSPDASHRLKVGSRKNEAQSWEDIIGTVYHDRKVLEEKVVERSIEKGKYIIRSHAYLILIS